MYTQTTELGNNQNSKFPTGFLQIKHYKHNLTAIYSDCGLFWNAANDMQSAGNIVIGTQQFQNNNSCNYRVMAYLSS